MPVIPLSSSGVAISELVRRVRRLVQDDPWRDHFSRTGDIDDNQENFTNLDNLSDWEAGDWLEFDDETGEQCFVREVLVASMNVERGARFTTATEHDSHCYVLKNPRFGYNWIVESLTRVIHTHMRGVLWVPTPATLTPSTSTLVYELPDDFLGMLAMTQLTTSTPADSFNYLKKGSGFQTTILRGVDASLSASGMALRVPAFNNTTYDVNITYGADPSITTVQDGPMAEAVVMGAIQRLMAGEDLPRTSEDVSQGDTTVQPGVMTRSAAWYWSQMERARGRAKEELLATWGPLQR